MQKLHECISEQENCAVRYGPSSLPRSVARYLINMNNISQKKMINMNTRSACSRRAHCHWLTVSLLLPVGPEFRWGGSERAAASIRDSWATRRPTCPPTDTNPSGHACIAVQSLVKIPYHKQPNLIAADLDFYFFYIHWQPILGFPCRRRDLQPQRNFLLQCCCIAICNQAVRLMRKC